MNKSNNLSVVNVNVFDIVALTARMAKCQFGYGFIARTNPKMIKPKTTAKEWEQTFGTPFEDVKKVTCVTNARAYDYAKAVNKVSDTAFISDPLKGYRWLVPNVIKQAIADNSLQLTLTFKKNDKTTFNTRYFVGDRLASEQETAFILAHLYISKAPQKQLAHGVAEEDVILVRNYKFDNIYACGASKDIKNVWNGIIGDE